MAELAFDNDIITNHEIYHVCGKTLDAVSKKDYPGEDFFDRRISCLDMDDYETNVCKGAKDSTMDAVIGVKDFTNNRFHNSRLLLVELRMDYKSDNNLSKTALERKNEHTRNLLGSGNRINDVSYFIFRPNVIQRIRRWFKERSQESGTLRFCEPLSTEEFCDFVRSEDSFPYTPLTDIVSMKKELTNLLDTCNYSCFLSQVEFWLKLARKYHQQYNNNEYKCIMNVLTCIWNKFRKSSPCMSDDERIDAEILEEDYSGLIM